LSYIRHISSNQPNQTGFLIHRDEHTLYSRLNCLKSNPSKVKLMKYNEEKGKSDELVFTGIHLLDWQNHRG
jgi:hypothetical protein